MRNYGTRLTTIFATSNTKFAYLMRLSRRVINSCPEVGCTGEWPSKDGWSSRRCILITVENAYVVGNEKFGIAEIPKLKADAIVKNDSNIGKNDRISDLVAEFNESSTLFKDFLSTEMRKGEVAKKQYCGSERICAVFKEHVKNLSPIGIIAEEAKVINFITSLSSSSNYSSPIQPSISSPKDPNLNALSLDSDLFSSLISDDL
uniref:Uncharacterized protein n=1 Tax=Caenorhabditis japonica TaxID=281687 RepID=A0A8R1EJE4_CAEJA